MPPEGDPLRHQDHWWSSWTTELPGHTINGVSLWSTGGVMDVFITTAHFSNGKMWLQLSDARVLGVPLASFPRLRDAGAAQLADYELSPRGIHWDALDEDLSLAGLLSAESVQP